MKIFSKLYVLFQRKLVNKYHNLLYCSSLQPVVCLQFHWNRNYFSSVVLRLRGQIFMAPWHGFHLFDKYDWFLHEWLLLDWIIFLLYLLQSVCRSKYSAKIPNFSKFFFLHLLHPFVLKHPRVFATVMRSSFIGF